MHWMLRYAKFWVRGCRLGCRSRFGLADEPKEIRRFAHTRPQFAHHSLLQKLPWGWLRFTYCLTPNILQAANPSWAQFLLSTG
jgi:hypothetical protein